MNNKKIIIFVSLLALWGISFFYTSLNKKSNSKSATSSSYSSKVKLGLTSTVASIKYDRYLSRENLKLIYSTDIFYHTPVTNNFAIADIPKTELKSQVKKIIKQVVTQTAVSIPAIVVTPPVIIQPVQEPQVIVTPPPPVISEETKVLTAINKMEISGLYKQGKTIIIFIIFEGVWYEFKNEGMLKVTTENASYDISVKALSSGFVLIKQDSLKISIKKRIKEE